MAMTTSTALLASALIGGGAALGSSAISSSAAKKSMSMASSPMEMPQAPSAGAAAEKGADIIRKKKAMATQSIYTSPLGVAGEAQVARKTLLGQ